MIFGAVLAIAGVLLFARRGAEGSSSLKLLGFEFSLGSSSLVVFVLGVVLFMLPFIPKAQFPPTNGAAPPPPVEQQSGQPPAQPLPPKAKQLRPETPIPQPAHTSTPVQNKKSSKVSPKKPLASEKAQQVAPAEPVPASCNVTIPHTFLVAQERQNVVFTLKEEQGLIKGTALQEDHDPKIPQRTGTVIDGKVSKDFIDIRVNWEGAIGHYTWTVNPKGAMTNGFSFDEKHPNSQTSITSKANFCH